MGTGLLVVKSGSILFIGFISFSTINTLERERERDGKKSHTKLGYPRMGTVKDRDGTPLQ